MSDTKTITPDELLKDANYAVVSTFGDMPKTPITFINAAEARAHVDRMESYGVNHYEVVEIDHDHSARTLLEGDCEMFQSRSNRLSTAMEMVCNYIESECKKLRDRHEDESYPDMSKFDDYRYDMDREAYATMSTIYALISGATLGEYGGMTPSFPIPDYD